MTIKRKFSIVDFPEPGKRYGEYLGSYPAQAANKAFGRLSRMVDLKNTSNKNFMVFTIEEQDTGEQYKFIGTRVELARPIVKHIAGKTITTRYKNVVTRYTNVGAGARHTRRAKGVTSTN